MSLNKDLINSLVKVTSRAAINCYQYLGKGDKKLADKAATDSMRNDLNNLEINGEVVIGEGELDEAPMLYICLLYTSPSPRDIPLSRMPSSA